MGRCPAWNGLQTRRAMRRGTSRDAVGLSKRWPGPNRSLSTGANQLFAPARSCTKAVASRQGSLPVLQGGRHGVVMLIATGGVWPASGLPTRLGIYFIIQAGTLKKDTGDKEIMIRMVFFSGPGTGTSVWHLPGG